MSVSKRLRYEVLRRDNHQCRYCGASAPAAILTVDHVTPTALGGSDDPSNLVAACKDCNSGKSASNPDAPLVADVAQDALRWAQAQQIAAQQMLDQLNQRDANCAEFESQWNRWTFGRNEETFPLPANWKQSVINFLSVGLPLPLLCDCIDLAMAAPNIKVENLFRYTCGIAWNKVNALQNSARRALDSASPAPNASFVSGSDVAAQAWGYLPDEVDDEKVAAWARALRESRAEDEDEEHDFNQWPDEACALLQALNELTAEYCAMSATLGSLFAKLPPDLANACRWESRRTHEDNDCDADDEGSVDRYAMHLALNRLLRFVSTHDERAELRQQLRAELGEDAY